MRTNSDLVAHLMKFQPEDDHEEELWVFSIIYTDPNRPTWEERIQIIGGYRTCCQQCAAMAMATPFPSNGLRVETRRGAAAEELLLEGIKQERNYQQECKAQPFN